MSLFLFALGVVGLTHIIVDSTIMEPFRNAMQKWFPEKISYMVNCYQCFGFWAGLFCGWACFDNISYLQILIAGFAGSFLANFGANR